MKRALVTGAAGFIGSNLAIELERRGWRVAALDDFSSGHFENLLGFRGDVIGADAGDPSRWASRVGPVDAVFHQAAITDTTVTDQLRMMRVNVESFRAVLDFAVSAGAQAVVYASSAGVYGAGPCPMREDQPPSPMNVYGFSKMVMDLVAAEFAASNGSMPVAGLRYFNVFGPGEGRKGKAASMIWQLYGQMLSGRRPRIFTAGEQFRDHIYVKDVVSANLKAFESGRSGVFNACTGRATDFNRIVAVLNETLGTRLEPEYFDNPYSFYQNQTQGDPRLADERIGFKSAWTVEEGVRDYLSGRPSSRGKG
jgi:ADP-L-glycero-D-manno-heptose 6-epimerase